MAEAMQDSVNLRRMLIHYARQLTEKGLTRNTTGNLSHRVAGGLLVTPTGMDYARLEADDIVRLDEDGTAHGRRLPSSEWRFHRDILRERPEVTVVLHAHSPCATSLACLREGIPPFHYMVATAGGIDIRCGDYATFGTAELSAHALRALDGRKACLLANHGMIALGEDFEAALKLAIEVETLAEMYWRARQIGRPVLLDEAEMVRVIEKFRDYGRQPPLPAA
jgi:L-fuculose-phosphate aldolase